MEEAEEKGNSKRRKENKEAMKHAIPDMAIYQQY